MSVFFAVFSNLVMFIEILRWGLRMKVRMLVVVASVVLGASSAHADSTQLKLQLSGTTVLVSPAPTVGGEPLTKNELDPAMVAGDVAGGDGASLGPRPLVNRTIVRGPVHGGSAVAGAARAKSNPQLQLSFDGLNFHDQRFANNGNQFSVEPPDQGLCAGNGFVMESVNDVLSIYNTSGTQLLAPVDLNTFYGYPAAINRSTLSFGPELTDPSCYYDADTQRWFHVALTLDRIGTSSDLSGTNHLDIAVSTSADPRGPWKIYRLPVQNNGTQGTPDHKCAKGFCLGDYPHIGADANAFFITTNEFSVFGPDFYGAQIYAISKRALAAGATSVNVALWNTADPSSPAFGFTVWPAISPNSQYKTDNGGTEYFLSSDAVFAANGVSNEIWVWSVTNTSLIDTAPQALVLNASAVGVKPYAVPTSRIAQKPGNTPLRDCVADPACAPLLGVPAVSYPAPRSLAHNDSRMQQVMYANGKLWGALDTDVLQDGGVHGSGTAYFVLNPASGLIFANDTLALPDASLSYPALAVTSSGRGVIAFTVTGPNLYPSAGYAGIDAKVGAGDVHIASAGMGPWDGFTGIPILADGDLPRWGDYGAAVADGDSIWVASEYIAQTCTYAQYKAAPFGQCGGTRGALGNWATRISKITPLLHEASK
jgi:hypothetical protein